MHEIKMPQLGQSVEEASITQWHKNEGDAVAEGEPLFSVQTDKAEIECESTAAGVLRKILVASDCEVPVMTVVALVGTADEPLPDLARYAIGGAAKGAAPAESAAGPAPAAPPSGAGAAESSEEEALPDEMTGPMPEAPRRFVSPRAARTAQALKIDPAFASGSGPDGRVMECDVIARAEQLKGKHVTSTARVLAQQEGVDLAKVRGSGPHGRIVKADITRTAVTTPPAPPTGQVRRVPLTPMRRIIAERMCASAFAAPHYFVTFSVDMAAAGEFRKSLGAFKPSYSDLLLFACARALREFPAVNARWVKDAIEEVGDINLGLAVALPAGLIVPVIKQAQTKSLKDIHLEARTLVEKARTGKLTPDDYTGNTFTVSNLGVYGVDHFTAIINQPDSAILAIGQIKEQVVVIDGGIHIRPMMNMTMSSDHRVVDGAVAAQFMSRLKEILERADF